MQQSKIIVRKCIVTGSGLVWIAGLLMAGSDSPYMPWLNGMGLAMFFFSSILIGKIFHPSQTKAATIKAPVKFHTPVAKKKMENRKNQRINTGYALGI